MNESMYHAPRRPGTGTGRLSGSSCVETHVTGVWAWVTARRGRGTCTCLEQTSCVKAEPGSGTTEHLRGPQTAGRV